MNYTIKKDFDSNLVTVIYSPDTNYQDRIDVLKYLIAITAKHPTVNFLIDVRNANHNMTPQEQMRYGKLIGSKAKHFLSRKTAILSKKASIPHPLIPPTAYLEGFEKIVEFDNQNEAKFWLKGEMQ